MTRHTAMIVVAMGLLLTALVLTTFAQTGQQPGSATGQNADPDALSIALLYLEQNSTALGLTAADLAEVNMSDVTVSRLSGVTAVYLEQQLGGIAVFNGLINIGVMPNGDVLTVGNRFASDLAGAVSERTAVITAEQAVQTAAAHLGLPLPTPLQTIEQAGGAAQETVFSDGRISQNPIPARLVYDASGHK